MHLFLKVRVLLFSCILISLTKAADEPKFKCPENSPYFYPCTCEGGGENGIFIKCQNTNIASIALGLSNVRLPIQQLHLYRCNMKRLYGQVFSAVPVHDLLIEDTPITTIEKGVLEPLAQVLKALRIIRANLDPGLPYEAIKELKKLEVRYFNQFNTLVREII